MEQKFERVARHLYKRTYRAVSGDWSTLYYARFKCRLKKKPRLFALGSDLAVAKDMLKKLEAQDVDCHDFDLDKRRGQEAWGKPKDGKSEPWTFAEWAERYPSQKGVRDKRSLEEDKRIIRLHLEPFFGPMLLIEITRESLTRYSDARESETVIRQGKHSKKKVSAGTVANELSLLRHMLRVAAREGYKVVIPSFDGLIVRSEGSGRALSAEEQQKVLAVYPKWLARLSGFAKDTGLSQCDILRLNEDMIDRQTGVIVPEGGRKKTEVEQVSPLTDRAREILDEIKREKRVGAIVKNVGGLIFTREDGKPITRSMISKAVRKAARDAGVKKFVFHNYRNTALTEWRRQGIPVDAAMRAGGWSSVQMYKRYLDLNKEDIARAFGTSPEPGIATGIVTRKVGGYPK